MAGYTVVNMNDLEDALEAGPNGLEVVAIGSDRPEGGDGETVEDWWTD